MCTRTLEAAAGESEKAREALDELENLLLDASNRLRHIMMMSKS